MIRKEILNLKNIPYPDEYIFGEEVYSIVSKLKDISKEETMFLLAFSDGSDNNRGFELEHDDLSTFLIKLGSKYKLID